MDEQKSYPKEGAMQQGPRRAIASGMCVTQVHRALDEYTAYLRVFLCSDECNGPIHLIARGAAANELLRRIFDAFGFDHPTLGNNRYP